MASQNDGYYSTPSPDQLREIYARTASHKAAVHVGFKPRGVLTTVAHLVKRRAAPNHELAQLLLRRGHFDTAHVVRPLPIRRTA